VSSFDMGQSLSLQVPSVVVNMLAHVLFPLRTLRAAPFLRRVVQLEGGGCLEAVGIKRTCLTPPPPFPTDRKQ
jgi:hypothetical protein